MYLNRHVFVMKVSDLDPGHVKKKSHSEIFSTLVQYLAWLVEFKVDILDRRPTSIYKFLRNIFFLNTNELSWPIFCFRSHLIWICTVCYLECEFASTIWIK